MASGLDDAADIGIELGAPRGAEAVGDLAEGDAGPQRALGAIVGWWNVAVGDEDEQVAADFLDSDLEFDPGSMGWWAGHEAVEVGIEAGGIGFEGGIGQPLAPLPDLASPSEQVAQAGRKLLSPASMAYWASRMRWARQT